MTEEEYRELQERVHILKELANGAGWLYLVDRANDELLSPRSRLRRGLCETLEEYKFWAGFVQGAEAVLSIPERADKILEQVAELRAIEQVAAADEGA